jgi:hypothetical protein
MATAFSVAQMNVLAKENNISCIKAQGSRDALFIRSRVVNFDSLATLSGVALAHSDTYPVLTVNAGELIVNAGCDILTAATGAADIDLGFTGGDVDGLVDGIEANDATFTVKAARGVLLPLYIDANDTVDVLESAGSATLAACVARVWVMIAKF